MQDNKKQGVESKSRTESPKKRSFFGGEITEKTKDLLDFRYNTQEEIDKLNDQMTTTNDLDEMIRQTNNPENNVDNENIDDQQLLLEPNQEENSQIQILNESSDGEKNDYEEISKKEKEPIEGKIVENPDKFKDNIENDEESNKNEVNETYESSQENKDIIEQFKEETKEYEPIVNKTEESGKIPEENNSTSEGDEKVTNNEENDSDEKVEDSNSAKFYDPFELSLDENEQDFTESNNKNFDPFTFNEEESVGNINDNNETLVSEQDINGTKHENNNKTIKDQEENKDKESYETYLGETNESENEIENQVEDEAEDQVEDEAEDQVEDEAEDQDEDEAEDQVEDEAEDQVEDETEDQVEDEAEDQVEDEAEDQVEDETEDQVEDETEDQVEDETEDQVEDETEDQVEDETEDQNNENIIEESISETNEFNEQIPHNTNQEEKQEEIEEDNVFINTPVPSNSHENDKKGDIIKNKKIKKNSSTGEIITDEEIQLEQGQDSPNSDDDEDYKPTEEELFEYEPEFFADDELSKQFMHLVQNVRGIFKLEHKDGPQDPYFKILGSKTANSTIEYLFYLIEEENEPIDLYIKKVETDQGTEEENEHLVQFSYNKNQELNIFVDEVILYEGINKLNPETQEYNDTKAILEKFIFLTENYYNELKEEIDKQHKEKQKKRQLQQIFKGF